MSETGAEMIAAERQRQVDAEGWTAEHDDEHFDGELVAAARAYLWSAMWLCKDDPDKRIFSELRPPWWPWDADWWKPSDDPVRNLVKAGALVAAEIDRLQRERGTD